MKKEKVGTVLDLFIYDADTKQRISYDYIELDEGGVIGDKHYGKDPLRSVLLISQESYQLVKENDIQIEHAALGENILIDYNPQNLPLKSTLQIDDVILEISQQGTLCNGLSKVHAKLPKLLKHDRGIFATVVQGGTIKKTSTIYLLSTT